MTEESIENFKQALEELKEEEKVNIVVHPVPDPDAVGSAMGLQMIFHSMGIESEIYYQGEISHPQNKTIVNILNVTMNKIKTDISSGINVCVDCTENNAPVEEAFMVIDHHKSTSRAKHKFIDSSMGSCATMIWEFFKGLNIEPLDDYIFTYTALLLGVRTDTNDLISQNITKSDFQAYQELLELSDTEKLQQIMNYPYPKYLYDKRLELHEDGNSQVSNGIFVGGIGFISADQRDVIAIIAEEYTRMESINSAIIFAITDKKELHVSMRTTLVSTDVNQTMKDLFGQFGGGKLGSGGARIPLYFYEDIDEKSRHELWDLTRNHMFKKVLRENYQSISYKNND